MDNNNNSSVAILVTRPEDVGKQLSVQFSEAGFSSYYLPTLEVIGQSIELPIVDYDIAIFISANAVKFSFISENFPSILPSQCLAVGPGTAKKLQENGVSNILVPEQFSSEGLLAMQPLQSVRGKQILIIKGQGGRSKLQDRLTKRGADCYCVDVYRRISKSVDATKLSEFLNFQGFKLVTIASTQTLDSLTTNMNTLMSESYDTLDIKIIVASDRIKHHALELGYRSIFVADTAANDAMFNATVEQIRDLQNEDSES